MITNAEFLQALFGDQFQRVHVTGFGWDPSDIPKDRHLQAWAGGHFSTEKLKPTDNQYFTISLFSDDEEGVARRRKALFEATYVITLDDVREKLSHEMALLLPEPTYKLETSPGSEQWGYKLTKPCAVRSRVENLLDGLVASGLAPYGRDPGMKGTTRYLRLPEGYNLKQSKMMFGAPWKCKMLSWKPEQSVAMEELARPFAINLDATRREQRVDGAAEVPNHPVFNIPEIQIKETRSPGRFDVVCPWVDEHTGAADDGAAIFTNEDSSLGFKCHHGSCESRTARDLVDYIEELHPGFQQKYKRWQVVQSLPTPTISFADAERVSFADTPVESAGPVEEQSPIQPLIDFLRKTPPNDPKAMKAAEDALRLSEDVGVMERNGIHDQVKDLLGWSQKRFEGVLSDLKKQWFASSGDAQEFYQEVVFVREMNQFFNTRTGALTSPEGFTNGYMDQDADVRKNSLQKGLVRKVDRVDYAPGMPPVFEEENITYANLYSNAGMLQGSHGDCSWWLDHWRQLGWGEEVQKHMLQFMAFTILHPEQKINHMMILGSPEGSGKDFLLSPLLHAMGEHAQTIQGSELTENYTEFLYRTKYLHVNEVEVGDHKEAKKVSTKLKPIAAAPPDRIRLRIMYSNPIKIRNLVNGTMCTNSTLPLQVGDSRRFYAVWSRTCVRGDDGNMTPAWRQYWESRWKWMNDGGYEQCIWYLRNKVDLSDFNPGAPPPVTEFLRSIQDQSKPPIQKTIELLIKQRNGVFAGDICTSREISEAVRSGGIFLGETLQTKEDRFTTRNVERALREMAAVDRRVSSGSGDVTLWIIRDVARLSTYSDDFIFNKYQEDKKKRQNPKKKQLHTV